MFTKQLYTAYPQDLVCISHLLPIGHVHLCAHIHAQRLFGNEGQETLIPSNKEAKGSNEAQRKQVFNNNSV